MSNIKLKRMIDLAATACKLDSVTRYVYAIKYGPLISTSPPPSGYDYYKVWGSGYQFKNYNNPLEDGPIVLNHGNSA